MFSIEGLKKTSLISPIGEALYVWKDLGTYRILTDGYFLYKERPDRKGIDPNPIAEGKPGYVLTEASPIDQFFMSLKEDVKVLALTFIKQNPGCLLMDVIGYLEAQKDKTHADLGKVLLEAYGRAGAAQGLFTFPEDANEDQKFEVLRDFIANTPDEELQNILS